jgi:hypothetical protein
MDFFRATKSSATYEEAVIHRPSPVRGLSLNPTTLKPEGKAVGCGEHSIVAPASDFDDTLQRLDPSSYRNGEHRKRGPKPKISPH